MRPPSPYQLLKGAAATGQLVQVPSSNPRNPSAIFASDEAAETLVGLGIIGLRGIFNNTRRAHERHGQFDLRGHYHWVDRNSFKGFVTEQELQDLMQSIPQAPRRALEQSQSGHRTP